MNTACRAKRKCGATFPKRGHHAELRSAATTGLNRVYRDGESQWVTTTPFGHSVLPATLEYVIEANILRDLGLDEESVGRCLRTGHGWDDPIPELPGRRSTGPVSRLTVRPPRAGVRAAPYVPEPPPLTEMPELTRRDFLDLGPAMFEQLVGSLVRIQHSHATAPAAPDGGADVLVPADGARKALVWQVKHFEGSEPPWKKCEESLEQAVARYGPGEVTFVFSRDLTQKMLKTFERRLQKHENFAGIKVRQWGIFELREMLAAHPEVRTRYFGDANQLPAILRSLSQGGQQMETGADLVARAFALSRFADEHDPSFRYEMRAAAGELSAAAWDEPPFIVMTTRQDGHEVQLPAWARPEAKVGAAIAGFTDDEAGAEAREYVRRKLAAGEQADISSGFWVQLPVAPTLMKDAFEQEGESSHVATLQPGDPVPVQVSASYEGGALSYGFDVRPVPPERDGVRSYGAIAENLELWLNLVLLPEEQRIRLEIRVGFRPGDDYARSGLAATFAAAVATGAAVDIRAPDLLPDGPVEKTSRSDTSNEEAQRLQGAGQLYLGLALIEQTLGLRLRVPEIVTWGDVRDVIHVACMLQDGEATMNVGEMQQELDNDQVAAFVNGIDRAVVRATFGMEVLGKEVTVGRVEFPTPRFALVVPTREGLPPGRTMVRLVPEAGGQVRGRLVETGVPAEPRSTEILMGSAALTAVMPAPLSGLLLRPDGTALS